MSTRMMARMALALMIAVGAATYVSATHAWGNYHWARKSNPFTLKVGDNLSGTWDPHLTAAVSDWSLSDVLDLTVVTGGTKPRVCKATAGRIEVCNERYGFTGWLGIAQIWASGDHITQAVAKMNDSYFNGAPYNTPAWRQLVMCQEIAHDFGLDHQDEEFDNTNLGTCMDYTSDPTSNQHPNAHDYEELDTIYSHVDSTTTVGASILPSKMPPAMGQINFDTPGQWGRLVHSSENRRVQVFELDFGNDNRVITHVFWADSEHDARR